MAKIIFVDEHDNVIGVGSRDDALKKGIIHRIARVFLFNARGEILLQRRANHLPSNPGKWDQSATGYVDAGEKYLETAMRETEEELGIQCPPLVEVGKFFTEEPWKDGTRKRFNTLFRGVYDGEIHPSADEVSETEWVSLEEIHSRIQSAPEKFTFGAVRALEFFISVTSN